MNRCVLVGFLGEGGEGVGQGRYFASGSEGYSQGRKAARFGHDAHHTHHTPCSPNLTSLMMLLGSSSSWQLIAFDRRGIFVHLRT